MTFIDFHTHHTAANDNERAIIDGRDTWGIHPWTLADPATPIPDCHILAIGECGLDKLCGTPFHLQQKAMLRCISESERLRKPLILHCVRSIGECLALRRQARATQPWIWHGYRGNSTLLRQLLPHNFYFSFGFRFNEKAITSCPHNRMLLESDDDTRCVSLLYKIASSLLNVSTEALTEQMWHNYDDLFAGDNAGAE